MELIMEKKIISSQVVIFILLLLDIFIISTINSYVTFADIAFVLLILTNLRNAKGRIIAPTTLIATVLYFAYSIMLSSVMIVTDSGVSYISYLYIVKELVYLSAFFVVINSYNANYLFSKKLIYLGLIMNLTFGLYSIISGEIAHYGVGSIVSSAPSKSGIVYLTCFFVSFIYFTKEKKKSYLIFILISIILVFATISRTAIVGLVIFLSTFLILTLLNKIRTKFTLKNIIVLIGVIFIFFILAIFMDSYFDNSNNYIISSILDRFNNIFGAVETRSNVTKTYYNGIIGDSTIRLFFGQGKSIPEVFTGTGTLAVDNQYTRFILEGGIIGLLLWMFMVFSWLITLSRSLIRVHKLFLVSFVVTYMTMGMGYEVFQVSKSGLTFWFVLGVLYANRRCELYPGSVIK